MSLKAPRRRLCDQMIAGDEAMESTTYSANSARQSIDSWMLRDRRLDMIPSISRLQIG
jgi:hypothetical protein